MSRTPELQRTLNTLAWVLGTFAALTVLGAALLGRWAAGRVVAPLDDIAGTAARVAGGDLSNRLPTTEDPDLVTLVGSFNAMVDALTERIERDARFTADVSHELRSPLTTLTTSVQLLERRRDELPERHPRAGRPARFRGRAVPAGGRRPARARPAGRRERTARRATARWSTRATSCARPSRPAAGPTDLLAGRPPDQPAPVDVDKLQLARALVNLFDNADRHGSGVDGGRRCGAPAAPTRTCRSSSTTPDPASPPHDRERIFERFVRGGSRGSLPGTGLGLSLVAETMRAHGGSVHVEDVPGGGARFVLRLPVAAEGGRDRPPAPSRPRAGGPGGRRVRVRACGSPGSTTVTDIDPQEVPYDLLDVAGRTAHGGVRADQPRHAGDDPGLPPRPRGRPPGGVADRCGDGYPGRRRARGAGPPRRRGPPRTSARRASAPCSAPR